MNNDLIVFIFLTVSVVILAISAALLMILGQESNQPIFTKMGKILLILSPILLIVGVIGLFSR